MFELVVIFMVLLCFSAFFSGSETVFFSLSEVELHQFGESGSRSKRNVVLALARPRQILVTILLGNELVNVAIAVTGAAIVARMIIADMELQALIGVAAITPVILVFGEVVPKSVSLHFAPLLAPIIIWPLALFAQIVRPIRAVLGAFADAIIRLFGGDADVGTPIIMEDEFRRMVDIGSRDGVIEEEEREIIHKVFEFTDKRTCDIMTPIDQVFMLSIELPYERMLEELRSTQFSRVPIIEGGDRANVVGILHLRELFGFDRRRRAQVPGDFRSILLQPLFVSEVTPLETLLREFQRTHMHMALVKGQDEVLVGIVTMDDVLEELFGELEE